MKIKGGKAPGPEGTGNSKGPLASENGSVQPTNQPTMAVDGEKNLWLHRLKQGLEGVIMATNQ